MVLASEPRAVHKTVSSSVVFIVELIGGVVSEAEARYEQTKERKWGTSSDTRR